MTSPTHEAVRWWFFVFPLVYFRVFCLVVIYWPVPTRTGHLQPISRNIGSLKLPHKKYVHFRNHEINQTNLKTGARLVFAPRLIDRSQKDAKKTLSDAVSFFQRVNA